MGKKNRKCSKIDRMPLKIKETVEQMMLDTTVTYREIVDYIQKKGYEISLSSVQRHAANLNESASTLRMAQENFRVIMDEISKYPNLDTTEGIIRLLSNYTMEAINATPEERWKELDPLKLMQQATALTRAAAYKSKIDVETQSVLDRGFEYVRDMIFETMRVENPRLYEQVSKFVDKKQRELKQ
ncbi:MAG: DUF3486 family protein [Clostridia bacterium]|nr:DUF3486 family protein [Clostridia bacterium]